MPIKRAKKDPTPIKAQQKQIILKIRLLANTNFPLKHMPEHVTIRMANKKYLNQGLNILFGDIMRISNGIYANNITYRKSNFSVCKRQYKEYSMIMPYITISGICGRKPTILVSSANMNNNTISSVLFM